MTKLTRAQREALKKLHSRGPKDEAGNPLTYRQFRRLVYPEICGPAVMVPWCGMFVGIEPDGYTHT